jgi:cytidylate kinase
LDLNRSIDPAASGPGLRSVFFVLAAMTVAVCSARRACLRASSRNQQPPVGSHPRSRGPVTQHDSPAPGSDRESVRPDGALPVVAMDGPSGTGKSTVSRRLALRLGIRYLDTGAMYRAATLVVLQRGIDLADAAALAEAVAQSQIEISTDPHKAAVTLDGTPVDSEIRSGPVTAAVSAVSAVPAIRAQLVRAQRELIGAGGIVVEGRDIGSVVWPSAVPKIYLTASAAVRAQRRAGELGSGSDLAAVAAVADDIERRDRLDSTRAHSPLAMVADAIEFDTTELDIDEVVNRLVDIVQAGVGHA